MIMILSLKFFPLRKGVNYFIKKVVIKIFVFGYFFVCLAVRFSRSNCKYV